MAHNGRSERDLKSRTHWMAKDEIDQDRQE